MDRKHDPAMTQQAARWLLGAVLLAALTACGETTGDGDAGDDVPTQEFEIAIGRVDAATDRFELLADSDEVEIVVGFQGLNFVDLALRGSEAHPSRLTALVDVAFPDAPDRDYSFRDNAIEFKDLIGHRRALLRVPIGQDVAVVAGSDVVIRVELQTRGWHALASSGFRMVDNEQCFENPAGELECL